MIDPTCGGGKIPGTTSRGGGWFHTPSTVISALMAKVISVRRPLPPTPFQMLLSVDQAVDVLGISRRTLYRLLKSGEIVAQKLGRRTMFERDALMEFVKRLSRY
jgi:excisionase family DNA binding protein